MPEPKKPLKRLAARFFQVSVPLAGREPPACGAGSGPGMLVSPRNSVMFFLRRPGACSGGQPVPPESWPGTACLGHRVGDSSTAQHDATAGLTSNTHGTDTQMAPPASRVPPATLPCPH